MKYSLVLMLLMAFAGICIGKDVVHRGGILYLLSARGRQRYPRLFDERRCIPERGHEQSILHDDCPGISQQEQK